MEINIKDIITATGVLLGTKFADKYILSKVENFVDEKVGVNGAGKVVVGGAITAASMYASKKNFKYSAVGALAGSEILATGIENLVNNMMGATTTTTKTTVTTKKAALPAPAPVQVTQTTSPENEVTVAFI